MKRILLASLVVCLGAVAACGPRRPPRKFQQKLVILGFDGMDPRLVQKWMDEGKLPNMKKLAARGSGVRPLGTTHSPESPTAWASFATGMNAGKHNIYDFLIRDTSSYLPDLGMVHFEPPRFILNYIPVSKPVVQSIRGGTSFWVTAGNAGVRSSMLTVPVTFPPEDVPNGELLSGLPLPDIRRTMGTFYYFGTDLSRYEEGNTEFGGILKRLVFDGDVAQTELVGPPNPIVKQQLRELRASSPLSASSDADRMKIAELEAREDVRLPVTIHWNKAAKSATVNIGDSTIHLAEHQWSKWINLDFTINLLIRVHGMAQLYLIGAGPELQLYISPVNWRPDNPPAPMSSPASLSADIYERLGPYRTLGWAEATWPLNEDRIDEKTFMDDLYRAFDDRAQVILQRIDSKQWDLLVGVIESTDRVQHMMWRLIDPTHPMYDKALAAKYGDSIERVYRKCDDFIGEVMARVDETTPILIVSDHGFHSFRQSVNLNTWLVQEGFMAIQGQQPGEKKLQDLFGGGGTFWENVDWTHTRAYAMGLGQIYVNLQGREGHGTRRARRLRRRAERARRPTADDDRSEDEGADGRRGLQTRRHLQRPVPAERVGAAGRLRRGLPRVVAVVARRLAARDRLPEHEEVVGRPRVVRLQADLGDADLQPPAGRRPRGHHGYRADGVEVLRRADTVRYRWQADLLRRGKRGARGDR